MKGISAEEYKDLMMSVGTHRSQRTLSPLEVAQLLKKAIDAGATLKECAESLYVGTTQISTFIKLISLTADIQHLPDWRGTKGASVAFSTLAQLAHLMPFEQVEAAEAILCYGLTSKEVIQIVQIARRSQKHISDCIADVLKLRPRVDTRYVFAGAITTEAVKRHLEELTQHERDDMLTRAVSTVLPKGYPAVSKLGIDRFTITSNHDIARFIDVSPDQLEANINNAILSAEAME